MIDFSKMQAPDEEQLRWVRTAQAFPGSTYIPNRPQFELIRAVGLAPISKQFIFLVTSANGTGKSAGWMNILANLVFPETNIYPYARDLETGEEIHGFFNWPLYNEWPRGWPKKFWVISDRELVDELHQELTKWWPRGSFTASKGGKQYTRKVETVTGWEGLYKTTEQDWKVFEGANVGCIVIDEPCKKWQFDAAIHRTRKGGIIILTATAVHEAGWFLDSIIDKANLPNGRHYHQTVSIWANSIEDAGEWDLGEFGIQKKGNLEADRVQIMVDECDPDEYEARIEGGLTILKGVIFKNYDQDLHFQDAVWLDQIPTYEYRMIVDDHDRRPPAIIWVRIDALGNRHVIREWPSIDDPDYDRKPYRDIADAAPLTIYDYCVRCIEIEEELKIPLDRITRIFDPNFGRIPIRKTGRTVAQEWSVESAEAYRIKKYPQNTQFNFVVDVNDDIEVGHKLIREALKCNKYGNPKLQVARSCTNLDYAFRRYRWLDEKPGQREAHGLGDKIEKKLKDFIDVVRYDVSLPYSYRKLPLHVPRHPRSDYGGDPGTTRRLDRRGRTVPAKPEGIS